MKLIIGLGNPGKKYQNTRNNLGFLVIEKLRQYFQEKNYTSSEIKNFSSFKFEKRFNAEIASYVIKNEKVLLIMPQTFMNNSGEAILKLVQFYKLNPQKDIIVIYDDIDLPFGKIRTKGQSAGGHRGMDSIIQALGTKMISRIRCGILSRPKNEIQDTSKFVLQNFTKSELEIILKDIMPQVILEIEKFIE